VGRDDVLARLSHAVGDAIAGTGRVVLLTGEPGIGKTTLLAAAARDAADRGARVAWGWGWPGEGAPGYWPWLQVCRELGLRLPAVSTGEAGPAPVPEAPGSARFQFFDEVTSLLLAESRMQPLVILLDDLQWADRSSLLLLGFLSRRLPAGAAAVLGACRDTGEAGGTGQAEAGSPLAELAARSTVLPLAGLPVEAVERLVARVTGDAPGAATAAEVCRRTGGNPFFVEQLSWLMKAGGSGVPPGAREALAERFASLTPACAQTVSAAALTGQRFAAGLAAHAAGQPAAATAAALAEAARAGLVVPETAGAYRFAHDLFREYAIERQPATVRAQAHQRIGLALEAERARGGEASLAELAGHFVRADPASERAYRYSAGAARHATARLAYDEAAGHWENALAAVDAGTAGRTATLLRLAEARWRAGAGQAADEAYLRAAELARREGDAAALAHAALGLQAIGNRSWWPPDELVALLTEALDRLDGLDLLSAPPPAAAAGPASDPGPPANPLLLRLRVMASLARTLAWHGMELARARALAGEAVATARQLADQPTLAFCLLAQHNAIWAPGTAADRRELAAEIAGLAQRLADTELLIEARILAAADLLELADPAFRAELGEFFRLADASGQPRFRYAALTRRAALALLAGRFGDAHRLIDEAALLGQDCGEPQAGDVWGDQSWDLLTGLGQRADLMEAPAGIFPDPDGRQARGFHALVLLAAGDRTLAAEVAAPLLAEHGGLRAPGASDSGDVPPSGWLLDAAYGAELTTGLGALPQAQQLYEQLAPFAGLTVSSGAVISFRGAVDHHLGVLAACLGRTGQAAGHLTNAIEAHDRLGALPWGLRSRYELAKVQLAERGQRETSLAELDRVGQEAERLGMAQLAREAAGAAGAARGQGGPGGPGPGAAGVFRRDGAVWTLSYAGETVRLRDAKGLRDLAVLLASPGRPAAAVDLVAAAGAGELARAGLGLGADDLLDETALRQIRARLADLDEEVSEAERWSDPERAARAHAERDALVSHLGAATGLGGRARKLGDQAERARKTVTARIRDTIGRIERAHPPLGAHLRATVTTGTYCTYSPPRPVTWQL
jgi:hypothetical protein